MSVHILTPTEIRQRERDIEAWWERLRFDKKAALYHLALALNTSEREWVDQRHARNHPMRLCSCGLSFVARSRRQKECEMHPVHEQRLKASESRMPEAKAQETMGKGKR